MKARIPQGAGGAGNMNQMMRNWKKRSTMFLLAAAILKLKSMAKRK